jgi:hypothetical protein
MNKWLVSAGCLSAVAALLHLAIVWGGPDWYRFFGAGEGMARAAAQGHWRPALYGGAIAALLALWSAYAFSGAGLIRRLPLLRLGLLVIAAIYLLRAALPLFVLAFAPQRMNPFILWSSLIVLIYGLAYAIGTWRGWHRLGMRRG